MSIRIEKLSKRFPPPAYPPFPGLSKPVGGPFPVFENITLDLSGIGIFALTGPNGSGKTTLLKILATLILPSSGAAYVCGHHIINMPEKTRRCVGFAYDAERSFYQALTLRENLSFFGKLHGLGRIAMNKRIDEMLEAFDIGKWQHMQVSKCSSGVKQKAALARALIPDPKVLLVDEISRSLDEGSSADVARYIKEYVRKNHAACLFVTHDMNEAKTFADASGRLENGKLEITT